MCGGFRRHTAWPAAPSLPTGSACAIARAMARPVVALWVRTNSSGCAQAAAHLQVGAAQLLQLVLVQKLLHALLHRRPRAAAAAELAGLPALLGPDCKGLEQQHGKL